MEEIRIGGLRVHNVGRQEAVAYLLEEGRRGAWVVTPNAVMLDACRRDGSLATLLNGATLSVADGAGIMLAARRQGTPLCERVAGITLGEDLLAEAAARGLSVFLLGGREDVCERAATQLRRRDGRLQICGSCGGYFEKSGEENERVLSHIRACRPDILFVCFGFPLQEKWIAENRSRLDGIRVIAGLGGALDVWSGRVRRAPAFLSRLGLEWAWRMMCEPKRLRHLPAIVRCAFGWGNRVNQKRGLSH